MAKIKVLLVAKSIDGGTGTFVLSFLNYRKYFNHSGINIDTVVLESPTYYKIKASKQNKITFLRPKRSYPINYSFSYKNLIIFINDVFRLNQVIQRSGPAIIVAVNQYANILLVVTKLLFFINKKVVFTTHNNVVATIDAKSSLFIRLVIKKVIRIFYKYADINIVVSNGLLKQFKSVFKITNVLKIYNGVHINNGSISIKKGYPQIIKIVAPGRLEQQKDFETILKALTRLDKNYSHWILEIIGEGELKKSLKEKAVELGIRSKISFLGWKQNIENYIKHADLFILSSNYEGFSLAIIEAMKYGIPIISTNAPYGPSEILKNGKYGLLVPIGDEGAMEQAIYSMLTDKKTYHHYSKKALERSKYFTMDKMMSAYKKVFLYLSNKR